MTSPVKEVPPPTYPWLSTILVEAGLVPSSEAAALTAGKGGSVWDRVVKQGLTTDQAIVEILTQKFKVPAANLDRADNRIATLVPESVARQHRIVPITADDRTITIATADPRDLSLEDTLAFVTGRRVQFQVAPPSAIEKRIDDAYRPERSVNRLLEGLQPSNVESVEELMEVPDKDPSLEAPMSKLVDAMISEAVRDGASDIHAEPLIDGMSVRYRVDGVLKEVMRLPASAGPALVRRVKILGRLDVTDPLHPHDGRAGMLVNGKSIDLRIATVPMARRGEKVVIRILDQGNLRASVKDLNLPPQEEALFRRFLGFREGMILVTGPTGSGKTTTLYALVNELKTGKVNIITVEDPVEYDLPGVSQLQVNESQGFTFATALRSVLRQDPDILLVGEIRDAETAGIAIQSGLSGHLVLSTLHTNDAPSAVIRLRDLGADAFKLSAVLKGVVAQRLVRRLCTCAEPITVEQLPPEARPPAGHPAATPKRAVGCKACGGQGFKGRVSVLEIMPVDETVARLVQEGALPPELVKAARPLGMRTLWESAIERVWSGQTTLEEAVRVIGEQVQEDGTAVDEPAAHPSTVPETVQAVVPTPAPGKPAGKLRVLVADDDAQMRRLIKMILEREGYEVVEGTDGLEALDALDRHPVDLMILDVDMPRLNGLGVLEELRARVRTSNVPVIVLTARTDDTEARVLDLGAQDFLNKPVQPQSLLARVRAVLRRAGVS